MKLGVGRAAFAAAAFGLLAGVAPLSGRGRHGFGNPRVESAPQQARIRRGGRETRRQGGSAARTCRAGRGACAGAPKHWYEKLSIRGYTQMRYNDTINGICGTTSTARMIAPRPAQELPAPSRAPDRQRRRPPAIYISTFSSTSPPRRRARSATASRRGPPSYALYNPQIGIYGNSAGNFAPDARRLRRFSIDEEEEFRFRVGQSKIPYGFENMQSSQNRLALDRADAINSLLCKDERDLGIFFYYTPEHMRHLFRDLVRNNLKGTATTAWSLWASITARREPHRAEQRRPYRRPLHLSLRLRERSDRRSLDPGLHRPLHADDRPRSPRPSAWPPIGRLPSPVAFPGAGVPFVNAPGYFDGTRNLVLGNYPARTPGAGAARMAARASRTIASPSPA